MRQVFRSVSKSLAQDSLYSETIRDLMTHDLLEEFPEYTNARVQHILIPDDPTFATITWLVWK